MSMPTLKSALVAPTPQNPQDSLFQGDRVPVLNLDRPSLDPLQLDQLNARFLRQVALTETGMVVWRRSASSSPVCTDNPAKPSHSSHPKTTAPIAKAPIAKAPIATVPIAKLSLKQKAHLKAAAYWLHHYNPGAEATRSQQLEAYVEAHDQLVDAGAWSLVEQLLGELRSPLVTGSEALNAALNPELNPSQSQKARLPGFPQGLQVLKPLTKGQLQGKGQGKATGTISTAKPVNQLLSPPTSTWHEQLGELGCYQEQVRIYSKVLAAESWGESQRLPLMLKLSRAYSELGQVQQAETWGRQALHLAQKLEDLSQEAEAWGVLGHIVMRRSSPIQAISYFQRQLKLAQRSQSPLLLTRAWADLAKACTHTKPSQSLRCYRKAEKFLFKLKQLYGSDFSSLNNRFSGFKSNLTTQSTLKTATNLGNHPSEPETPLGTEASLLQGLSLQVQAGFAEALLHNNQYEAVIPQIQQLLPQVQAAGAIYLEYLALYTLGNAYTMQQNWPMAEQTYQAAIALVRRYHYGSAEVYLLNSLGVINCYFLKNYDKALGYLEEARRKTDVLDLNAYKVLLSCHIANCQRFMGNLAQARIEHQQALDLSPQVRDITSRALICSNFAHWYWQEKRFLRCFCSLVHCFWLVPPWRSANGRLILRTAREIISKGIRQGLARVLP